MQRIYKFFRCPGLFLRDYFNKKHPVIINEILCPAQEEHILIKNDLMLENLIDNQNPIDIVFTWVDNNDPCWLKKYREHCNIIIPAEGAYSKDMARFSNHNELYYALKSVRLNVSWVRNIFIVTDAQRPRWLDDFDNVTIIDHKEIIPERYLPTFNSHVIEAHLHKIPGLAEDFIYFNDDVFVVRPLPAGHFFRSNGIASLFVSMKELNKMAARGINTPTLSASLKCTELLKKEFNVSINHSLVHTYVPLKKSIYELAWLLYEKEIKEFLPNKFRSNKDLNLATFLIPWLAYIKGLAVPSRDICYYFNVRSPSAKSYYEFLSKIKRRDYYPHSVCANDFNTKKAPLKNYDFILKENLSNLFE